MIPQQRQRQSHARQADLPTKPIVPLVELIKHPERIGAHEADFDKVIPRGYWLNEQAIFSGEYFRNAMSDYVGFSDLSIQSGLNGDIGAVKQWLAGKVNLLSEAKNFYIGTLVKAKAMRIPNLSSPPNLANLGSGIVSSRNALARNLCMYVSYVHPQHLAQTHGVAYETIQPEYEAVTRQHVQMIDQFDFLSKRGLVG